jgi:two-component system, LytTR family, response regulator
MLNTVIVDDEARSRELLTLLLEKYCPDVQILGYGSSVETGLEVILAQKPALVLLDIELSDGTGFDLLTRLGNEVPVAVIFITAYDHYAVRAFRFYAMDYLLKPVVFDQLQNAIARVKKAIQTAPEPDPTATTLFQTMSKNHSSKGHQEKIGLPTPQGLIFVEKHHIIRLEADSNYTWLYFKHLPKLLVARTLKDFEELLEGAGFFRIHHGHLVNMSFIRRYIKGRGGAVEMLDGTLLDVASRRKEAFLVQMQQFSGMVE